MIPIHFVRHTSSIKLSARCPAFLLLITLTLPNPALALRQTGLEESPEAKGQLIAQLASPAGGLEEAGVGIADRDAGTTFFVPKQGISANGYTKSRGVAVPSSLLDLLDTKQERILVPAADISAQTTLFIQREILLESVIKALETLKGIGVHMELFDLENVPVAQSSRENVYVLDVPVGTERREWIRDEKAIVINLRSAGDGRPRTPRELGALINYAREADGKLLRVGEIYRSELQDDVIAIDTQL